MRRLRPRSVPERPRRFGAFMGASRIAFGAFMVLAPRAFLGVARTPPEQATPSARLLTRMTGMRDVLLGVHVLRSLGDRGSLRNAALLNACADTGDTAFLAISTRWENHFVAGASGVPVAASAAVSFLLLARSLD